VSPLNNLSGLLTESVKMPVLQYKNCYCFIEQSWQYSYMFGIFFYETNKKQLAIPKKVHTVL